MLDNKSRHFFCCHTFLAQDEYGCFGAVVIGNGEYRVISLQDWQFSNEIEGDCFEGHSLAYGEYGLQQRSGGLCIDFISLTFCASSDVIHHVLLHVQPPVSSTC